MHRRLAHVLTALLLLGTFGPTLPAADRPNILFAFADDWGWPHAGVYGDPVIKTPVFDRMASEGILFRHAYVSSPSCTPSRGAVLTGQQFWRLEEGANLYGVLRKNIPLYPDLLEEAGYHVGFSRKGWGPGKKGDRPHNPAGNPFRDFKGFLAKRPDGKPFCYWFGSTDPHRGYRLGSGKKSGMDLSKIKLFAHYPDSMEVRGDVADYYWEVQRFDREVGEIIRQIEGLGELDNTIVVMSGDHGMPFPRCKGNLYDSGARVPLAIRWPKGLKGRRVVEDFVSLTDLAPTYLEAAGLKIPDVMTGRSLIPIFQSEKSGRVDLKRDHVLMGKERHTVAQEKPNRGGTPMRAIRTHAFLYIRNYEPDRWPAGTPNYQNASLAGAWFGDCDNGPTKTYIVKYKDTPEGKKYYQWAFGKRPSEELFDLKTDPDQIVNVAAEGKYAQIKAKLAAQLTAELKATADPRETGAEIKFDTYPYYGGVPRFPGFRRKKKK